MKHKPLTIEDLRDLINKGQTKDPLIFLESVMNGADPRKISRLYKLVAELHEFSDGEPDPSDWAEIVDIVLTDYKYRPVGLGESIRAAKTVAEYLYAKRKQIDTNGGNNGGYDSSNNPLTEEEVEVFKEKFNEWF
jgi:hypothetical protein